MPCYDDPKYSNSFDVFIRGKPFDEYFYLISMNVTLFAL